MTCKKDDQTIFTDQYKEWLDIFNQCPAHLRPLLIVRLQQHLPLYLKLTAPKTTGLRRKTIK